jgi:sugar phosphate isomerase/epimerase
MKTNSTIPTTAIFAWFGMSIPFPERVRLIRAAGFDTTSLWWEEYHPIGRAWRDRAVECARAAGLDIDHLHVPYRGCNRLWSANDDERAAAVAEHIGWVKDCARHGVPILVMHPTLGANPPEISLPGLESFHHIVDAAEESGVVVALENMRANGHIEAVLRAIPSEHLGICFDVAHDRLWSARPFDLLDKWGHRVVTTHLCDCDGKMDRHWLPGEGIVDVQGALDRLDAAGYRGAYVLEVTADRRKCSAVDFLADAWRRIDRLAANAPIRVESVLA